jgi:hypothetical protein
VRYVFCCAERATRRIGLLEVGEHVAETIHGLEGRHNGLQYMCIEVSKHTTSNRSRMEVSFLDEDPGPAFVDLAVPDIKSALKRTWESIDKERGVKPGRSANSRECKPPAWKP